MNAEKAHMLAVATDVAALGFPSSAQAMKNFANDVYPITPEEWARAHVTLVVGGVPCGSFDCGRSPFASSLIRRFQK